MSNRIGISTDIVQLAFLERIWIHLELHLLLNTGIGRAGLILPDKRPAYETI